MASAQVKQNRKKVKKIFCLLIFTIMIATALPRITSIARLYEQKEALNEQKQQLEQEKLDLTATCESMDDLETVEKIAREKLGMIKEGERVMVEKKE